MQQTQKVSTVHVPDSDCKPPIKGYFLLLLIRILELYMCVGRKLYFCFRIHIYFQHALLHSVMNEHFCMSYYYTIIAIPYTSLVFQGKSVLNLLLQIYSQKIGGIRVPYLLLVTISQSYSY